MSATMTQLLSSGKFCKLRYDTIPVKSASANVSFYTSKLKMPNFGLWHSCHNKTICCWCLVIFQILPQGQKTILPKTKMVHVYFIHSLPGPWVALQRHAPHTESSHYKRMPHWCQEF